MLGHTTGNKAGVLRTIALVAALAGGVGAAGAQELRDQARNAAVGDGLSTAVGLAVGAAELNPLGPLLSVGMKAVVLGYVEGLPAAEQPRAYAIAASSWSGATANNICITAVLLTGGGFAPGCIALGVAWGVKTWQDTEPQRQLAESCAMLRAFTDEPELECMRTPPGLEVAAQAAVITAQGLEAP